MAAAFNPNFRFSPFIELPYFQVNEILHYPMNPFSVYNSNDDDDDMPALVSASASPLLSESPSLPSPLPFLPALDRVIYDPMHSILDSAMYNMHAVHFLVSLMDVLHFCFLSISIHN